MNVWGTILGEGKGLIPRKKSSVTFFIAHKWMFKRSHMQNHITHVFNSQFRFGKGWDERKVSLVLFDVFTY